MTTNQQHGFRFQKTFLFRFTVLTTIRPQFNFHECSQPSNAVLTELVMVQ